MIASDRTGTHTFRTLSPEACLGLGTGTLASLGRSSTLADTRLLLDSMLELGLSVIDTADSYASGDCEILLAKAMRGRRERFTLVTKAGYRHGNLPAPFRPLNQFVKKALQKLGKRQQFDATYLRRCLENSLRRLGTDHVEGFLLHDPPVEAAGAEETAAFLQKIRTEGKARAVGVSSGDPQVLQAAMAHGISNLIETPASIGVPDAVIGVWRLCAERGIHVIGNHVFEPISLAMEGMTHQLLMRASAALLPPGSTILCGTRNPSHLESSSSWARNPLPEEEVLRLRNLRLG